MKKKILIGLLLSMFVGQLQANFSGCVSDSCDCDFTGQSYMAIRPLFQSASPELISADRAYRVSARENGISSALEITVFGSRTRGTGAVQRYFTPFCKTALIVDEQRSDEPGASPMDLRSTHFNVFTKNGDFRSIISLEPRQTVFGVGLYYRQAFCRLDEWNCQWFFSFSSPLTRIKNEMRLCEEILISGGGPYFAANDVVVANMQQAFNQKDWNFGKIDSDGNGGSCSSHTKTRFADIEAKIGIEWIDHDPCHLESYIGALIPTGNKAKSEVLFEPIVGHGKHWGVMWGGAFGAQLWADESYESVLRFELSAHSQYLFRNTQVRSFDLKNKPWSRYMQVYANEAQAMQAMEVPPNLLLLGQNLATPGINIFTQPVNVTPGFSYNTTGALVFDCNCFQGEIGYNFYARHAECVELACDWMLGPVLKAASGQGMVNPVRDITGFFILENIFESFSTYEQYFIRSSDLDLNSAAQPALLTHTIYGAVGCHFDDREYPTVVSVGGSYEFPHATNAGFERWTLWGKVVLSF